MAKIKLKKRFMLLMEILIALFLIAVCVLPLIAPHVMMAKEQHKLGMTMKIDHAVHLLYVDVLEQLHKNKIPWNTIQDHKLIEIDDKMWERIGVEKELPLRGFFRFDEVKHKPKKPAEWNAYLLTVTFYFLPPGSTADVQSAPWIFPYDLTILKHSQVAAEEPEPQQQEAKPDANKGKK